MRHEIAIVGIGCRFPGGASTPSAYWELLADGRDAVRPVPADRWPASMHDEDPATPGRMYAARGGFLDDPATAFDAAFFGISPREAETLDPQQRLLLEVAFEALEDAGVPLERARALATGVFVGGFTLDSMLLRFRDLDQADAHTATSSSMTLLSNRISYALDLRGPSMTIDTACSSSLVATHLAARAILDGECELALAGGVNLMLLPNFQVVMCKGRFLAPDGRSKAFGADADGYGRGEGAGLVVLKRLDAALRDGDRIHAVLSGTGVNQDGATDGIAQPSGAAQEALIRAVCARHGLDPAAVGYVEAHGTGTAVGDPIEVGALGAVYGRPRQADAPRLGSVKANIGHLEAAAGVAGLIKAALAVSRRTVPPHRAPGRVNPALHLDDRGLRLPFAPEPWPLAGPAVAAVNSFGYGGTNAHAVVREAPAQAALAEEAAPELLAVSARGAAALAARAEAIARALEAGADLPRVASTLAHRRAALASRAAVRCPDVATAIAGLRRVAAGTAVVEATRGVVWLYSGMGPQWAGMGRGLAARPAFRAGWDRATAALLAEGLDVRDALERDLDMGRNDVAQPCNFALQVALTEELRAHGAVPDAIVGHSTGEMAAAWAAGALTLEEAARVVAVRARLQQEVAGGGMLAVGMSAEAVEPHLRAVGGVLEVAAINAPTSTTVAGDREALAALARRLEALGVFARPVRVEVAYHSAHMDPIGPRLRAALAGLRPTAPAIPLWSTVTGRRVDGPAHDAGYWWANTRGAVRLAQAFAGVAATGPDLVLQVGPHPVLAPALAELAPGVRALPLLSRGADETETLLGALGGLWEAGAALEWGRLAPRAAPVDLPTYPWQRQRYWADVAPPPVHPLLAERLDAPDPTWTARIDGARWRWLHDHRVDGAAIVPGALWIEVLLAAERAGREDAGGGVLADVRLHAALALGGPGEAQTLRTTVTGDRLALHSRGGGDWRLHAEARRLPAERWALPEAEPVEAVRARMEEVPVDELYAALDARGLSYGPAFRGVRRLWRGDGEILARVGSDDPRGFCLPPDALDAAFQALLALRPDDRRTMVPVAVERAHLVAAPAPGPWTVHGTVRADDGASLLGDLALTDASGRVFLAIVGLRCRRLAREEVPGAWWHRPDWVEAAMPGGEGRLWLAPASVDPVGEDLLAALLSEVEAGARDLVVVTRGAWSVDGSTATNPAHAALWGLARVVMTERPELGLRLLDAEADTDEATLRAAVGPDEEAAVRGGRRFVARLRRADPEAAGPRAVARTVPGGSVAARLVPGEARTLDELRFVASHREQPGPGEVEIAIEATSLNFKDVMKAMGLLDEAALERSYLGADLGMEAVGTVARAGEGVALREGERVLVYAGGCFRTHARVDARFVVRCPEGWTAEQAASFFVTCTAWHALVDVGRIRPGETVLVHSAAGGVGLAAVGIARAFGARVIATAGTARKRAWLREQGVEVVLDSRTLDFADAALRATGGRGVDVVLNALAGPAIEAGLRALAPGGRFLELGKKDLADRRTLALGAFNRRLTLSAIDLDRAATEDPGYFGPLAQAVLQAFADGRLPHLPARTFATDDVVGAFRALAGGDWIGKVVVDMRGDMAVHADHSASFAPRAGRTWLVTGGLGGFGLALAARLVEAGVTHLVLAGRRGAPAPADRALVDALSGRAEVRTVALDVTDAGAVDALVAALEAGGAPLGGVVHAATAYADAPIAALGPDQLREALGAKARGAWNLHRATLGLDLDGFVLCSSVSALVGNPGQAAYAAANTFLDGLAELRAGLGLAGTSVALGALADTGLVARDAATEAHLRGLGLSPMPARAAAAAVTRAVSEGCARVGVIDIDWEAWVAAHPATPWRRLEALRGAGGAGPARWSDQLAALPPEERVAAAVEALAAAAAPVFRMDAAQVDPRRPLRDLGLDSLMAVELATAFRRGLGLEVSAMDLLGGRTLVALAARLVDAAPAPTPPVAAVPAAAELRARICVEAPYEALEDLRMDGDVVRAAVRPVALEGDGPVSAAELGRHLAILGSMAVAARHPEPVRHAYPVHWAELELDDTDGPPVALAQAEARTVTCDPGTGRGEAETALLDGDGRRLGRMRVGYHVLPMSTFRAIYAARARSTPGGADPYGRFTPPRVVGERAGALLLELPPLAAEDCLGHFDGLPAMPVSILGRHVFAAVAEAARRAGRGPGRLLRARLQTHRFVWPGERAQLVVSSAGEGWACEVRVGDELAARFELHLAERWVLAAK